MREVMTEMKEDSTIGETGEALKEGFIETQLIEETEMSVGLRRESLGTIMTTDGRKRVEVDLKREKEVTKKGKLSGLLIKRVTIQRTTHMKRASFKRSDEIN